MLMINICIIIYIFIYFEVKIYFIYFFFILSYGGNIFINVGLIVYGIFFFIYEERFCQLGFWLKVNGEGIYVIQFWVYQNDIVIFKVWYVVFLNVFYMYCMYKLVGYLCNDIRKKLVF